MNKKSNTLIIIPAYNEQDTIREVVGQAMQHADVCVVNDCSKDDTAAILAGIDGIHVIHHQKNTHIPGAVLDGMKYAAENGYEFAITMDAGFSHDPRELPTFLKWRDADLVIGTRLKKLDTPLYRRMLSRVGNGIYNLVVNFPNFHRFKYFNDIPSGYRLYSKRAMQVLIDRGLKSKSFDFLVESVLYIHQSRLKIAEAPITYIFSNSSLRLSVLMDCLSFCGKSFGNSKR